MESNSVCIQTNDQIFLNPGYDFRANSIPHKVPFTGEIIAFLDQKFAKFIFKYLAHTRVALRSIIRTKQVNFQGKERTAILTENMPTL